MLVAAGFDSGSGEPSLSYYRLKESVIWVQVVGREGEREAIEQWLDGERPASLLIEGTAGIGKSTLWSHAVECAEQRGDRVLSWRASIAERDLAFAVLTALFDRPVVNAFVEHLADPRRRALDAALGRIDPEARPPEPSLIGLALTDVLTTLSSERPLLVAIDDVQWTDQASEAALSFAARRLRAEPVGFVVARRTVSFDGETHPGPASLEFRDSLIHAIDRRQRIEVGPMSAGALGRLIHERLGVGHPRPLLLRLHQASSGNPLLGLEISRSLMARRVEPAQGEPFPVPAEAGPLLRDHLTGLGRDARRSLVIVAMSADPTLDLLVRVLGEGAVAALDEAVAKGVLTADGPRVHPTHPLFASTAYADAPPGERRALRQALADATDDPVERAIHLAAMIERPDDRVAEALAAAARLAAGRGAPGIATNLFERAAQVAAAEALQTRCRIDAAEAAVAAGDPTRAAAGLCIVLGEVPTGRLRAEALLALGEIVYVEQPHEALDLLVAALDHTEGDPILDATAHAYIASMADMDPLAANRSALAAVEILGRPGVEPEPDQLACALLDRAFHWLLAGERVATDDIDRGIELMRGTGTSFFVRRGQEVAERCLFHLGRLTNAIALDEEEHRRLTEGGQLGLLPPLDQSLSVLHLMTGDWPAARRYAQECMDLVDGGEEMWRERALTARARILAWEGDLGAARSIAVEALGRQEAAGDRWEATIFCALLGFIELSIPNPPEALDYLTRGLAHTDAMEVKLPTQFRFLGDLVEAAVLTGDLDLAERVLRERLEESATRLPLPWTRAMVARGRGLLEAARRDFDAATGHLDLAVDIFTDELPMPFECARAQLARGQVHRHAGHRRAARQDVVAARATLESLGARVWGQRATQELARIGGRVSAGTALTSSELVVAELAAAGRSNREIAAELVVSVRTVESQLSAAYRKLGIGSRGLLRKALAVSADMPKS